MSSSQERLKLMGKRGNKPSDPRRHKPSDTKHNYKDQINIKKDRNMAYKGLKRRLSAEGEVSNKKTRQQVNSESVESNKEVSAASKPQDNRNSAANRLARLRDGLKESQSTSQPEHKSKIKKYLEKTSVSTNQRLRPDTQVITKSDHKNLKKTNIITNQNTIQPTKSDIKSSVQTISNFKIPIKKSINDRFKLAKERNTSKVYTSPQSDNKTKSQATVISGSPKEKCTSKRDGGYENGKCLSPLKKKVCGDSASSDQRLGRNFDIGSPSSKSETSFRLSNDYIVISEASASESEASSNHSTPASSRLTSIRNRLSSDSDRTLTPGSPATPASPTAKKTFFKTPLRPPAEIEELKVPLNRGLLRRRIENAVQTGTNIFRNTKVEEPVTVRAERRKNIFGAQFRSDSFQNNDCLSENIFASSNMPRHNNNPIVTHNDEENTAQKSIFGASISQKNIFSNFSAVIPPDSDAQVTSFSAPRTNRHTLNDTYRPEYPSEPTRGGINTERPQILCQTSNPSQSLRKSASDRLARIRNEGCNTYRKNHANVRDERVEENPGCNQIMMNREPTMGRSTEGPFSAMLDIQGFKGTLERVATPNKPRTFVTERLTQDWLETHQRTVKDMDMTMSDSMMVNVDETILNKSELPDPIEDVSMEWDNVPQPSEASPPTPSLPVAPTKENIICVVTDTNVFMHFLHRIKDAINFRISGSQKIKIYVPWMVLKELDHLKDHSGEPTRSIALEAQRFINRQLAEEDSKIIGQSVQEVSQQQDIGKCPDDKILACCLQAKEKYETVILLTNDINLRNAATFNDVYPCTPQEILSRLKLMTSKRSKFAKIRTKLVTLWSEIICDCCKEAYGDAWKKMDMLQNPPWSMLECVKRFKRYWGSVFRVILLKHSQQHIDGIYNFLMKYKDGVEDDTDEFNEFATLVLGFMVFLQDLPNHKTTIKRTLKEIVDIMEGR